MSSVDIEYCGAWGYGAPANKLKKAVAEATGKDVNCHSAGTKTGTIKVSVAKNGALTTVW